MKMLFVNSYQGAGIGDFGFSLHSHLKSVSGNQYDYIETGQSWRAFFRVWRVALFFQGQVIMNIGFTSFGRSMARNFLSFVLIRLLQFSKNNMTIILHDSIEMIGKNSSGYKVNRFVEMGGSLAITLISSAKILVFSNRLYENLVDKYGCHKVKHFHFPCRNIGTNTSTNTGKRKAVITIGYIAPYKGLDILPEIKRNMPDIDFFVVGSFHKVLSEIESGKRYFDKLKNSLLESGIKMTGYIGLRELERLLSEFSFVGVLPYVSSSGSSYSAIFLVERGIPLIATPLPEMVELETLGAGIRVVEREPKAITDALSDLCTNVDSYREMQKQQESYCAKNTFENFAKSFVDFITSN